MFELRYTLVLGLGIAIGLSSGLASNAQRQRGRRPPGPPPGENPVVASQQEAADAVQRAYDALERSTVLSQTASGVRREAYIPMDLQRRLFEETPTTAPGLFTSNASLSLPPAQRAQAGHAGVLSPQKSSDSIASTVISNHQIGIADAEGSPAGITRKGDEILHPSGGVPKERVNVSARVRITRSHHWDSPDVSVWLGRMEQDEAILHLHRQDRRAEWRLVSRCDCGRSATIKGPGRIDSPYLLLSDGSLPHRKCYST